MKVHLNSCQDWTGFIDKVDVPLRVDIMEEKATEWVSEAFNHFRVNASEPLSTFLDFITYEYMITNTLKLIQATKQGKTSLDAYYKLHPLGYFQTLETVGTAQTIDDLYSEILVDSPIGKFFQRTVKQDFDELSMEYMKNLLYKNWIESFYDYVMSLGGITAEVMGEILEFEADQTTITITKNSFAISNELPKEDKILLYPKIGQLVMFHEELADCKDKDKLKEKLEPFVEYAEMFAKAENGEPITEQFKKRSVQLYKRAFDQQFQFGAYYAFLKLKELEINNIVLIADCITMDSKDKIKTIDIAEVV
jgi:V-type H+-transporting ATPase subunit d